MEHKIIVAGIGPGNPRYIVEEAKEAIANAKVLVGGKRALSQFKSIEAGQKTMTIAADIPGVLSFIDKELQENDVVVMVSGDPGYYSLLDALRRNYSAKKLQVIPGISSMQLAFAKLSLPWHDAELVSFHGRVPQEEKLVYEPGRIVGMLTDGKYNSHTIPEVFMAMGWPRETKLGICSRLSYEDEVIIETTLGEAKKFEVYTHCILVVTG
ncbi:MAG: precorrin-6y C5,15-methyltransferase (decarboxylating) subunit CbiE [Anaerovibrio sp.]|nr:precorrin-6y C5,15-methyltransferase (decarboxylating) subunit CbiE [Selenomonadaceae bacterium]MDD6396820.1 precorrin-6y C5,15-methyltransferase (decarboxylating) subunit CbiE [Selenomonadaceae bacterium]MDY6053246.1 precorrin-6y C5,15-methyltransferase (decarboxylating) subunit CbiE [Anaerovibrio sp.]